MKKFIILSLLSICAVSCNAIRNAAFQSIGIYDDKISLQSVEHGDKRIVFFPMHHIGTKAFYDDVTAKTDSLKAEDYFFLYEKVTASKKNDTLLRKYRKLMGLPVAKSSEEGYIGIINAKFPKFKFKKEVVNQPSYEEFGLTPENSINADANLSEVIDFYESKYGKVVLSECDFETSPYEEYSRNCKKMNKINSENFDDAIVNFRNDVIVQKINELPNKKIAVIYGEDHIKGVIEKLEK
ncbi:MAG: hypothetical protein LBE36_12730 [Flavobacteriaceae bacterium]|jgi:hypothetical protein|nr:hypothetical protein [Flavobacteriaceae bacterium]